MSVSKCSAAERSGTATPAALAAKENQKTSNHGLQSWRTLILLTSWEKPLDGAID